MNHCNCHHLVHSGQQSDDAFPPTSILFEYCLNIKDTAKSSWTPLHIAAGSLNTEATAALIASGANTNSAIPNCGRTALHVAVRAASSKASRILGVNIDCISLLLSNGANVNIPDREGRTPVHEACSGGRRKIVDLLLEYKADMNSLTRDGQSPVFLFLQHRSHLKDRALLNKLLGFSYPLKLRDNRGNLPTGLLFSEFQMLKDFLLTLSQKLQSLEDICKITVRRIYGENNKYWLKTRLPATVWNSLYSYQDLGKYARDDSEQERKPKNCKP
ncbi:ankyrin repeat domain-containing protein 61 [Numida meleagris]|uniref:ankyrin repeat domain-containing protein 61 n=1 Tax=Numida meleagris TaxID=8996 RepID=UPI000B3E32A8|nr:ankyrin repeat domain-containing protein 61 [Numida meleagris]XP_021267296.1 ankyrin repeat domain-containing protein 61 [Numida meleagris]XP_021267297.1 ankyrin repeat domain-containing protein 61 [Numida meleagris]